VRLATHLQTRHLMLGNISLTPLAVVAAQGLFERQGTVLKLELKYDRAGRSEGIAFVTYEREADAKRAISEFDGANANGPTPPSPLPQLNNLTTE